MRGCYHCKCFWFKVSNDFYFFSRLRADWCLLSSQHVKATTRFSSSFGGVFYVRNLSSILCRFWCLPQNSSSATTGFWACDFIHMDGAVISWLLGVNGHRFHVAESAWPQTPNLVNQAINLIAIMEVWNGV